MFTLFPGCMLAVRTPGAPQATRSVARPAIPPSPLSITDPDKLTLLTRGFNRATGAYEAHGVPAPIVAQYLRENRVVPEKNDLGRSISTLPPWKPILALPFPPAMRPPRMTSRMAWTTDRLRIVIHHLAKGLHASKLAEIFDRASSFSALVGMAVDAVSLFMALLSSVESAPRAYRLKASNAAPPISTSSGTIPGTL